MSAENKPPTERFSSYVVIPANVFFDRNLSDRARLLYGLISNMSNQKGFCWAKNETLGKYLGTDSDRTIRRLLGELKDRGYIRVDQQNDGGTTVRKIWVAAVVAVYDRPDKNDRPPGQICPDRPDKNDRQNNTSNNNIPPIAPQGASSKSKPKSKPTAPVTMTPEMELQFNAFWNAYPNHDDKQVARRRWVQLAPDVELQTTILESIEILKQTKKWQNGAIPMPSTFLNNRRWEDAEDLTATPDDGGRKYL